MSTLFYLGTHMPNWLWTQPEFPLFVSRNTLRKRVSRFPAAVVSRWAMDSGGFSELHAHGRWRMPFAEYADFVLRCQDEIGRMDFAAPQDWMCEDSSLAATGKTVEEHQERTVQNFLDLRPLLGSLVIPVLQGNTVGSYLRCADLYASAGVDLARESRVGLGSVCRRQSSTEIVELIESLPPLPLHGFGVKTTGLQLLRPGTLASADSMAWSFCGRRAAPLVGCKHKNCANCFEYARRWRERLITKTKGVI